MTTSRSGLPPEGSGAVGHNDDDGVNDDPYWLPVTNMAKMEQMVTMVRVRVWIFDISTICAFVPLNLVAPLAPLAIR